MDSHIFHEDGKGFLGGSQFSRLHHPVIEVRLVDDLSRMSHQLPDLAEDHRMFRVVLPDLFVLLTKLLSHCRYLCRQLSILRLHLLELLLIRPLCQFPKDIFGSAVVQGLVCSPGDVLKSVVLGLELLQLIMDLLEGVVRKIPSGMIHVLPRGLPARFGFRVRMRWRKGIRSPETRKRASGWWRRCFWKDEVAWSFRPGVHDFRLEFVCDLIRDYG